jgi:uncharacterized membrane protein
MKLATPFRVSRPFVAWLEAYAHHHLYRNGAVILRRGRLVVCEPTDPGLGFGGRPRPPSGHNSTDQSLVSMHRNVAVLALAALAATTGVAQAKPATRNVPRYKLVELPLRPLSISHAAFVAGTTPDQKAAIWSSQSGLQKIDLPAEFSIAEATAINRHGDAVGTAYTADSGRRIAFLFRQRKVLILTGEQSRALGLNDAGAIVGQARLPGGKSIEPVVWRNPDPSRNNPPEALRVCCAGIAKAVTQRGEIVGDTYDAEGRYHAFLWTGDGRTRRLGLPSEQFSSALALNNLGQVVLRSDPAGLFLYQASKRQRLELPPG